MDTGQDSSEIDEDGRKQPPNPSRSVMEGSCIHISSKRQGRDSAFTAAIHTKAHPGVPLSLTSSSGGAETSVQGLVAESLPVSSP